VRLAGGVAEKAMNTFEDSQPMIDGGYSPRWIGDKVASSESNGASQLKVSLPWVFSIMTRPIEPSSGFWNIVEKLTRILTLTLIPFLSWMTWKTFEHEKLLAVGQQWRESHEVMAKEKIAQIDRIDRELQEWRIKFNVFTDETRSGIRSTDTSVRDVAARINVMSDTLIRLQEGQSAIREKMVNLQVVTDELNKGSK
jgi:hypothetical protein